MTTAGERKRILEAEAEEADAREIQESIAAERRALGNEPNGKREQ